MLLRTRTLLLGAGICGALAFAVPAAHATEPVAHRPAAHNGEAVRAVGFMADGVGGDWVISGGEDARLRSWTLQLVEERVLAVDHIIYDLESPVGGSIVATGEGGWNGGTDADTLRIWSAQGLEAGVGAPIGFVYVVALPPDERWVVASGFYGDLVVYAIEGDLETGLHLELYATKETGRKRTKALAFSPDGSTLAAAWKGGAIQLFSFPDPCTLEGCELEVVPVSMNHPGTWDLSLAFSPDSTSAETRIVSGSDSGMIKLWTLENLDDPNPSVSVLSVDASSVRSLAWSPDDSMIVAGGNGDITVYNADTLGILSQFVDAHAGRVNDVAFSRDSSQIASGGNDGALKLWQAPSVAGCSVSAECDDSNDCTADSCVDGTCEHAPAFEGFSCSFESGICCGGSCEAVACTVDSDCDDGNAASIDSCTNGGTCAAACNNTFPECGIADGICGPLCDDTTDPDCACVPTHTKEKGPRCRDDVDNDCDDLTDGDDPDC